MTYRTKTSWTTAEADDYYGFSRWGDGFFRVDSEGFLCVLPEGSAGPSIRLSDILAEAESEHGLRPPLTIRVQDILRSRVVQLNEAFRRAIEDEDYPGAYRGVFPIKVNQLREVVEEIHDAGAPFRLGLEAGSKPELLIALALLDQDSDLLICNGYKDADYIRIALMGQRLGREVVLVIEQFSEVGEIIRVAREVQVKPRIGFRIKLSSPGEGRWAASAGDRAKFGLNAQEVIAGARRLKAAGLADSVCLVHFHIGSQVPNILTIKQAVIEAARYYCELRRLNFPLQYLDVGGGLGIDYDGSRTNSVSSTNYSIDEYARDIVSNIKSVCTQADVECPDIVSESGRAIVSAHSVLVVEAVDRVRSSPASARKPVGKGSHPLLRDLQGILDGRDRYGALERFHDALQKREEAVRLFTLGYLDLPTRARAEGLFGQICSELRQGLDHVNAYVPDELERLPDILAEQFVCNFSVFQSLLDHWALGQVFPIAPISRLNEEPTVDASLVDITCDSDGKVNDFVGLEEGRKTLRLHAFEPGSPYHLGIFLVGAYQDIMGDLHNLFGRVSEVHVFLEEDEEDGFYVEETINGITIEEVLRLVQYRASELTKSMKKQIARATRRDVVKPREGVRWLNLYTKMLKEKTYLSPERRNTRRPNASRGSST